MIGIVCAFFHTEGKGFYSNILVLLCICTTLYNETLRCCFAIGEKKYQKIDD